MYLSDIFNLACTKLTPHMKEKGKDRTWLTRAQKYCEFLVKKTPLPENCHLDKDTKRLVESIVDEARDEIDRKFST